ncbi:MAG: hypothetical protein AVDCRST_MAG93-4689, partial [uncultured Chloroflexia bacterium]
MFCTVVKTEIMLFSLAQRAATQTWAGIRSTIDP